jgi:YidC/Oxa1 family membrane protein insertase
MPLLLQMPIFWAVYLYLGSSLDVRHQPWIGWLHDLSKPDHLYILPILMCVTMIASTQLTPQPPATDPSMKMQRVMMTWLMPIMLTWFFFFSAPSGLVLYWMVSNIVGVLIQLIINKKTAHLTAELQAAMPGKTKSGGSDKPGKSGKSGRRRGNAEAEGF